MSICQTLADTISKAPKIEVIMQAVDTATISAADKAMLREGIGKLQKKIQETSKMAGQENKRKAVEAALEAAKACESSRAGFLVAQLDVGLDTKAVQEAYKAVQQEHSNLPSLFLSADTTGTNTKCSPSYHLCAEFSIAHSLISECCTVFMTSFFMKPTIQVSYTAGEHPNASISSSVAINLYICYVYTPRPTSLGPS